MQLIKQLVNVFSSPISSHTKKLPKLRVGILGTGKIGTDLLVKIMRSDYLECVIFSGRNLDSEGMRYAANLGVPLSDQGINVFKEFKNRCDVVFDATSAAYHVEHAQVFERLGIFAIDMTPSQIGECCVPALGMVDVQRNQNVSMISCGGQSSIPIAQVLARVLPNITHIDVSSVVSANSIGPGTIANINEYYQNTKAGLLKYTQIAQLDVVLNVEEVNLETPMLTTISATCSEFDMVQLEGALQAMVERVQCYVPGYKMVSSPRYIYGGVSVDIQVEGVGDYLPKYAGNLDIINCAAIAVAEEYARLQLRKQHLNPKLLFDDAVESKLMVS